MLRRKRLFIGIAVIALIPIAALAWWLASPLFLDKTVDEEFPFAASAIVPTDMTIQEVQNILVDSAKVEKPVDEAMPDLMAVTSSNGTTGLSGDVVMDKSDSEAMTDKTSDAMTISMDKVDDKAMTDKPSEAMAMDKPSEAMDKVDDKSMTDKPSDAMAMDKVDGKAMTDKPSEAMAMDKSQDAITEDKSQVMDTTMKSGDVNAMTDSKSDAMAMDKMTGGANGDTTTEAKTTQPSAAKLKEGSFRDADPSHRGSGTATIYRGPDGSNLLRLEDFKVTNGPDLRVILSPHENPTRREHVTANGYIELDKLKGNKGNQNYAIPDDVDISVFKSVVIYCKPFQVIFSVASLEEVN